MGKTTSLIVLGCIAYIFKRGVDASKAGLLKEALLLAILCFPPEGFLTHLSIFLKEFWLFYGKYAKAIPKTVSFFCYNLFVNICSYSKQFEEHFLPRVDWIKRANNIFWTFGVLLSVVNIYVYLFGFKGKSLFALL